MKTQFDAIIIGTGQAGPPLAGRLTQAGMKVAIIERKLFGGTCVNNGCTPTKAMVASAHAAHLARRASSYGVSIDAPINVDMKAVKARKDKIVAKSNTGVESWLRHMKNCSVFNGHARFLSPREVQVGDQVLTAQRIFINVGGRATLPKLGGIEHIPYLTNVSLLKVDLVPRHLIIVGGSYVGLEFGQMFSRFGSEVTILEKGSRLLAREDEDVSAAVTGILQNEAIHLRIGAECMSFQNRGEEIIAHVNCTAGDTEIVGSHVLIAAGRQPNTDDLGLAEAGIEQDRHGFIVVDDQLHTNVPGIWALGDCNGKGAFTHTSYNDFEIVSANLLDNGQRRVSDRVPCYAMYIDPPLARIGLNETAVRQSGKPALMATRPMTKVSRAIEKGETEGFMKILVDAENKKILGASLLGTGGDEAIHCIIDVMYAGAPYTTIQQAVHIHPTVSELIPTMLGDLKPLV